MTELSGGVVSLLNKRRRACLGVECQIVGDAVAYRNQLLKWNTNCLAEAYKLSYIVGSLSLAKNAKHSPSYYIQYLTLGAHAQEGYGVCLPVCLSVCYHLIFDIVRFYGVSKVRTGSTYGTL